MPSDVTAANCIHVYLYRTRAIETHGSSIARGKNAETLLVVVMRFVPSLSLVYARVLGDNAIADVRLAGLLYELDARLS